MPFINTLRKGIQSPREAFSIVFSSPAQTLHLLRKTPYIPKESDAIDRLFSDSSIPLDEVYNYLDELDSHRRVLEAHNKMAKINGVEEYIVPTRCLALYTIIRYYQPETVVETGSYYGHSTLYILLALSKNNSGNLYSFDAHPHDLDWHPGLPDEFELGMMVPNDLRGRWNLHEGDITNTLGPGLKEIGQIDLFFHDSDHSEDHKRFEFDLALQYMNPGGILASHDVGHGNGGNKKPPSYAFVDVANELNATIHSPRSFKPGDEGERIFAFLEI